MDYLGKIPITSVISLTPEQAVTVVRAILRAECGYVKLGPQALTISSRLTLADGGIDAEIRALNSDAIYPDCIFQQGVTGYQIKSGASFKPWTKSCIEKELLNSTGELFPEVKRLLDEGGAYTLISTGYDLTPQQKNIAKSLIANVFTNAGFSQAHIEVLGASQVAEYAERYPGVTYLLGVEPVSEAWVLEEWLVDIHLTNKFEPSEEQSKLIEQVREALHKKDVKHLRIQGEPGIGKTRLILEAVKDDNLAPYVLYIQSGSSFKQTMLFKKLLRFSVNKPLILVIDDLEESEMIDIWRQLKVRCGLLKIVTLDHGKDESYDRDILWFDIRRLPDETIKKIFFNIVGDIQGLDRWVEICQGSPRVAIAVADNLLANPDDILRPPSTVPIWSRFLHGYGVRDEYKSRQIECVAQHLALFSRFGYKHPVSEEAKNISKLIQRVDPSIGWAQFQEIVQDLRSRRVIQGNRTLFFVPKALHIYLWKKFWEQYGREFDFSELFKCMPESLHIWFLNMFKYAGDQEAKSIVIQLLKYDGIFSEKNMLLSYKGATFLSILAEANPRAVLNFLENTVATWSNDEILDFKNNRQQLVWALEKIAVWSVYTVRAINILIKFAINENSHYGNNATGTLIALFRIAPEGAATEASPEIRLIAMRQLLNSNNDAERRLAIKIIKNTLTASRFGRIIGPEFQGLKERAKLWSPKTYGEWWQLEYMYFQVLIDETKDWQDSLQGELDQALLEVVEKQILNPRSTELAFQVLNKLVHVTEIEAQNLITFFRRIKKQIKNNPNSIILKRIRNIERSYIQRNLINRFRKYVLGADYLEWEDFYSNNAEKSKSRLTMLVDALAIRIVNTPIMTEELKELFALGGESPALYYFGKKLSECDSTQKLLPILKQVALGRKYDLCLRGYISAIREKDKPLYLELITDFLGEEETARIGVDLIFSSDYNDDLFEKCLKSLRKGWVEPNQFRMLQGGEKLGAVPNEKIKRLLYLLAEDKSDESLYTQLFILNSLPLSVFSSFDSNFIFSVVSRTIPLDVSLNDMFSYLWENVCQKFISCDENCVSSLLEVLIAAMEKKQDLRLQHSSIPVIANQLVKINFVKAWCIVKKHLEKNLPNWNFTLLSWLKGELDRHGVNVNNHPPILNFPIAEIFQWIEADPAERALVIAYVTPVDLDKEDSLMRELLIKYGEFESVRNELSASFNTGSYSGRRSIYLKNKRSVLRQKLMNELEPNIVGWLESEIDNLDYSIERAEIEEERSYFD